MHIGHANHSYSDPLLESVDIRQIYDKFPEKKGGLKELFGKGPQNAFFLVKFWVSKTWRTSPVDEGWLCVVFSTLGVPVEVPSVVMRECKAVRPSGGTLAPGPLLLTAPQKPEQQRQMRLSSAWLCSCWAGANRYREPPFGDGELPSSGPRKSREGTGTEPAFGCLRGAASAKRR